MEEFGERIIKVLDGCFDDSQYISIDIDDETITIYGILNHQTHAIKNFIEKIEIALSEKGNRTMIARVFIKQNRQFTTKMGRDLYKKIKNIV